jgi:hypothetical protein
LSSASFLESYALRAPVLAPGTSRREAGIHLIQWRLAGSGDAADRRWSAIERKIPSPTNVAPWAAPGTKVAVPHTLQWTSEARWREFFLADVEQRL